MSLSHVDPEVDVPHLDKIAHVCEYLLFAWLLTQAVRTLEAPERVLIASEAWAREYRVWVWMFAFSFGLLVEVLQMFLPWRSASVLDALMNGLGAWLGVWLGDRYPWSAIRTRFK